MVPVRLLGTITLLMSQICHQFCDPACRAVLKEFSNNQFAYKLRRSQASAAKSLRGSEISSFVFLNENLFAHIDFAVLYILDHPFTTCGGRPIPKPGDHRYIYHMRKISVTVSDTLPEEHFRRLPTASNTKAQNKFKLVSDVSTGIR
jgi:hypothetical protein